VQAGARSTARCSTLDGALLALDGALLGCDVGLLTARCSAAALGGGKFSDFEGGIRVNSFVSGGFLPAKRRGQEESRYVHIADWHTTFCALAGVDAHDERAAKVGLPAVDGAPLARHRGRDRAAGPHRDLHQDLHQQLRTHSRQLQGHHGRRRGLRHSGRQARALGAHGGLLAGVARRRGRGELRHQVALLRPGLPLRYSRRPERV
jgi:hypothetical protein